MATVTLNSAEYALKSFYLDVVANQLNTGTNALYNKIAATQNNVWGKEVRKAAAYGINGGISAGTETGDLPSASSEQYVQFVSTLKNLYGTIELSDKAIRASENSAGAFVNLLTSEMEGLLRAAKFNFGRMLYGDGSGKMATVTADATASAAVSVNTAVCLAEGMVVDIYAGANALAAGKKILSIVRDASGTAVITLNTTVTVTANSIIYLTGSKGNEITGLGAIFDPAKDIYGLTRASAGWSVPYIASGVGSITDTKIQKAIDTVEEGFGTAIDFIVCSFGVRRAYQAYLETTKRNVNTMELDGGFKAISYSGIPIVGDRFVDSGTMYLLDTADFTLHQLCDWRWLEGENGNILRQITGKPVYNATLVKYAELICQRPGGQAKLGGITEV